MKKLGKEKRMKIIKKLEEDKKRREQNLRKYEPI